MTLFLKDLKEAFKIAPVWLFMAQQEMVARYRRTMLGPWWITIGTGIGLIGIGTVWATLFSAKLEDVFPAYTTGFVCWGFVAASLVESPNIFLGAGGTLKTIVMPRLSFIFISIIRNLYSLAHTFVLCIIVLIIFPVKITWIILLAIPGLILITMTAFLVGTILGLLGSRFRDLSHIINAIMMFAFLLTPVMWDESILTGSKRLVIYLNPLAYYLQILRDPLLNKIPPAYCYYGVLVMTIVLAGLANYLYGRYAKRLIYWI